MNAEGKRALVLGGTSGIGLAAARQLRDRGAEVIVLSRSEANHAHAREELGEDTEVCTLDVLDREAMAETFARLAPFDILINAATGGDRATGPFMAMDLDGFQGGGTGSVSANFGQFYLQGDVFGDAIDFERNVEAKNVGPGVHAAWRDSGVGSAGVVGSYNHLDLGGGTLDIYRT